jgi:RHS repeat-associated protein
VEASQAWALDPTGTRFSGSTITTGAGTSASTTTRTYRYDDTGDSPAVIEEGDGTATRPVTGLDGQMAASASILPSANPTVAWQLTNLHGDVVATLANSTGGVVTPSAAADEYGQMLDSSAAPAAGGTPNRYGWLGGRQRSVEDLSGLTLMGIRLYSPITGRFLSTDSVPGGNANAYDYPADPVNGFDTDGRCGPACAVPIFFAGPEVWVPALVGAGALAIGASVFASQCPRGCTAPWSSNVTVPRVATNTKGSTTSKNSNNYKGETAGYTITMRNGGVWKFGITSVRPFEARPFRQLAMCGIGCNININQVFPDRMSARAWEHRQYVRYAYMHGHCPPGSPTCK